MKNKIELIPGNFFTITRGHKMVYHNPFKMVSSLSGMEQQEEEPEYSRQFEGVIFEVLEPEETPEALMVAAKVVYDQYGARQDVVYSLNLTDVTYVTLGKSYVTNLTSHYKQMIERRKISPQASTPMFVFGQVPTKKDVH